MYITKVKLENIRCFEETEIDLTDLPLDTSALIAGNNGRGKSSILRAIAMGLCDRDSAGALLRELHGDFIREGASLKSEGNNKYKEAKITIELKDLKEKKWKIVTTVREYTNLIIERVEQYYFKDDKELDFSNFNDFWGDEGLFISAYGAGLRTAATAKFNDYYAPDAVYSLFRYDNPLQDPEVAWRRLRDAHIKERTQEKSFLSIAKKGLEALSTTFKKEGNSREECKELLNTFKIIVGLESTDIVDKHISSLLKYVLTLENGAEIRLEPNGIFIEENGELIPIDALGDGFQALIKITLDIFLWYLLKINYDEGKKGESRNWKGIPINKKGVPEISGIVIIDEIEQHLHPTLQREVIKRFSEKFPKVQFIISTHSPLCLSGTADLQSLNKSAEVFSLQADNEQVKLIKKGIPRGLRTDQILVDYFELPTTINITSEKKINRLRELFLKESLDTAEQEEMDRLDKELSKEAPLLAEREDDRKKEIERDKMTAELTDWLKEQKGG